MRLLLSLVIFFSCSVFAMGRIGEDITQCDQRYGQPVSQTADQRVYKKDLYRVTATFFDGKCYDIVYSHIDGTSFSDNERSAIARLYLGEKSKIGKDACLHSMDDSVAFRMIFGEGSPKSLDPLLQLQFFNPETVEKIQRLKMEQKKSSEDKALDGL